jgi:hypothetical protein
VTSGFALPKSVLKGMQICLKKENTIPIDDSEYYFSEVDTNEEDI